MAGLVVWAALRSGAVSLADNLVLTLGMAFLAGLEQLAAWRASATSGSRSPGLPSLLLGIVAALPLALGAGPGVRGGLWVLLLWAGYAWVDARLAQRPDDGRWLVRGLVLLGVVQASLGLGQALLGELPAGSTQRDALGVASGTLRNPNHYATLLALTLAPALGLWRHDGGSDWDRRLGVLAFALWPTALLASRSRGGLAAAGVGLILVVLARRWTQAWRERPVPMPGAKSRQVGLVRGGLSLVGVAVVAFALGRWMGPRFELFGLERRLLLYEDVLRMIAERPVWGHGLGLFRWRFRPYQQFDLADRYDHAHNELLEMAAELGIPLALALTGLVLGRWLVGLAEVRRTHGDAGWVWGASVAVAAAGLQGLVDFGTRIPLNALLAAGLLALLPRRRGWAGFLGRRARAVALGLLFLAILAAGIETVRLRVALSLATPPETTSRDAAIDGDPATAMASIERLERAQAWAPRVATFPLRLGVLYRDEPSVRSPRLAREHLGRAMELNPWSWRYPRELGRLYDTLGQLDPAVSAHHQALALDPRAPRALGRLADLYLRHERPADAGRWLRQALASDPRLQSTLVLRWRRAGQPDDTLLDVWPVAQRGDLLAHLVPAPNQTTDSDSPEVPPPDPELALRLHQAFEAWMRVPHRPEAEDAFTYLEWLLDQGEEADARRVWHRLLARRWGAAGDLTEVALTGDRVWNGDFEHPIEGGPLGWRRPRTAAQAASRQPGEGLDGSWALEVEVDGAETSLAEVGWRKIRQTVLVEPGEELVFEGALRARGGALGAHLQLFDPVTKTVLVQGPKTTEPGAWVTVRERVEVPAQRRRLRVRIALDTSDPASTGSTPGILWVDGVHLRPTAMASEERP